MTFPNPLPPEMEEMRSALKSLDGSIHITYIFGHGLAAQVKQKARKVGPVIIPKYEEGQTLAETLEMLGRLTVHEPQESAHV